MPKAGIKNSIGVRLFIIAVLTLVLLIPAIMIQPLISERKDRRDKAANEISENWGSEQVLTGPIFSIPFKFYVKDDKDNVVPTVRYAHFLPEDLNIRGVIKPEIRYRGIYEVVVYNSAITISGGFNPPDLGELNIPSKDIIWKDAFLSLGISDMKGIKDFVSIGQRV